MHPCNERPMRQSGYTHCDCRDCFEIAIGSEGDESVLCHDCEDACCDPDGNSECCSPSAYGGDESDLEIAAEDE